MKKSILTTLAFAGLFVISNVHAQFATSVISYNPGSGFVSGYTDATTALGSPSVQTVDPDPVWEGTFPVDPFGPPYLANQVVSLGAGGSLTVQFSTPIVNNPVNPFGRDFSIFGNTGFIMDFDTFTATGGLFGNNSGST